MNEQIEERPQKNNMNFVKKIFLIRETSISVIIIATILIMCLIPGFASVTNIMTTLIGLSTDGMIAVGIVMVLVLGGIDLSVGSVLALSSVTAGVLIVNMGLNPWLASLMAILVAVLIGFTISTLVTRVKLVPFIITLSMMSIARGLAYVFTEGSAISLGDISSGFNWLGQGTIGIIPNPVIWLVIIVIIFDILMRKHRVFREIYYVGSNEKAARLAGINIVKIKTLVYTLCSLLCGFAGVVTLSRFGVATPTAGIGAELRAIAGAVIGGASMTGGAGTVAGSLLGIILVALVNNALVLMGVSIYWQNLVTGLVLLMAVIIDQVVNKKSKAS